MARRFCLLTTGRAGSTSLMSALEAQPDILVPNKQVDCVDNELVHPRYMPGYVGYYAQACGRPVETDVEIIEAFFGTAAGYRYAGFKSTPERHSDLETFIERSDIRFLALWRRDIASTVASFITAIDEGCWRRQGGPQPHRWRFEEGHRERVRGHLRFLEDCTGWLRRIPGAIRITYEELCEPGFSNAELDAFFERTVAIPDPQRPITGADYVENWEEFRDFVSRESGIR